MQDPEALRQFQHDIQGSYARASDSAYVQWYQAKQHWLQADLELARKFLSDIMQQINAMKQSNIQLQRRLSEACQRKELQRMKQTNRNMDTRFEAEGDVDVEGYATPVLPDGSCEYKDTSERASGEEVLYSAYGARGHRRGDPSLNRRISRVETSTPQPVHHALRLPDTPGTGNSNSMGAELEFWYSHGVAKNTSGIVKLSPNSDKKWDSYRCCLKFDLDPKTFPAKNRRPRLCLIGEDPILAQAIQEAQRLADAPDASFADLFVEVAQVIHDAKAPEWLSSRASH